MRNSFQPSIRSYLRRPPVCHPPPPPPPPPPPVELITTPCCPLGLQATLLCTPTDSVCTGNLPFLLIWDVIAQAWQATALIIREQYFDEFTNECAAEEYDLRFYCNQETWNLDVSIDNWLTRSGNQTFEYDCTTPRFEFPTIVLPSRIDFITSSTIFVVEAAP